MLFVVEVVWAEHNATSVKCFISEHRRCRRVVLLGSSRERKRESAGYDQRREVYLCAKPHFSKGWWTLMMVKGRTGVDAWYTRAHTHTHRITYQQKWSRFSMPLFWTEFCFCIILCRVWVSSNDTFSRNILYVFHKCDQQKTRKPVWCTRRMFVQLIQEY